MLFFFFFEEENPLGKEMHDEGQESQNLIFDCDISVDRKRKRLFVYDRTGCSITKVDDLPCGMQETHVYKN